jgi:hypothetical protein
MNRGVITLAGETGPATTSQVRTALERYLLDGTTLIDVDLTTVDLCDNSCEGSGRDVVHNGTESRLFRWCVTCHLWRNGLFGVVRRVTLCGLIAVVSGARVYGSRERVERIRRDRRTDRACRCGRWTRGTR